MTQRQMKLGLFVEPAGRHIAAWRHAEAHPAAGLSVDNLVAIASIAEHALFDFVFIADNNAVWEDIAYFQRIERSAVLDPMIVLPMLAMATDAGQEVAAAPPMPCSRPAR